MTMSVQSGPGWAAESHDGEMWFVTSGPLFGNWYRNAELLPAMNQAAQPSRAGHPVTNPPAHQCVFPVCEVCEHHAGHRPLLDDYVPRAWIGSGPDPDVYDPHEETRPR